MTRAIRGKSKERIYEELRLESHQHCRWYRKLCYVYKTAVNKSLNYLFKVVPASNTIYNTRNTNDIPLMNIKYNFFKNIFLLSTIIEWNKLDPAIRNSFKESIFKFIRPAPNNIFQYHNPKGIKYFTRLRKNFNSLRDHKFKHSFQGTINPFVLAAKKQKQQIISYSTASVTKTNAKFSLPAFSVSKPSFGSK